MKMNLKTPKDEAQIKVECDKLHAEIKKRVAVITEKQAEIKMLRQGLAHYQRFCQHPGQQTGYNERDGSWANECPVCGESH